MIPFHRHVKSLHDGHEIYECLMCGTQIDVGEWRFDPNYCWHCGIKFQGCMIPHRADYISMQPVETTICFQIELATVWHDEEYKEEELVWHPTFDYHTNPKVALELLRKAKQNHAEDNNPWNHYLRISTKQVEVKRSNMLIDTDKYFLRTGKKFNREDYEQRTSRVRRLP